MVRSATLALAALLVPALVATAQVSQQPAPAAAPVKPKHHSLLKGAAAGAVAGHEVGKHTTGHGHAVLGAIAGAEVQHRRNKQEKKAYQQAVQAQRATP